VVVITHDDESKIETRNLNVYFGTNHAIKDISLKMQNKRITSIIGPSGCGKSTFLRALNRMHDIIPAAKVTGAILLDGENIYEDGTDVVDLRRRVGMVFQKPNPFPKSIFDNVAYGPRIHGIRDRYELERIVEDSLKKAALWEEVSDRLDTSAMDLSGGQQQRKYQTGSTPLRWT